MTITDAAIDVDVWNDIRATLVADITDVSLYASYNDKQPTKAQLVLDPVIVNEGFDSFGGTEGKKAITVVVTCYGKNTADPTNKGFYVKSHKTTGGDPILYAAGSSVPDYYDINIIEISYRVENPNAYTTTVPIYITSKDLVDARWELEKIYNCFGVTLNWFGSSGGAVKTYYNEITPMVTPILEIHFNELIFRINDLIEYLYTVSENTTSLVSLDSLDGYYITYEQFNEITAI